jgi:two-component system, sensor histidine kinase
MQRGRPKRHAAKRAPDTARKAVRKAASGSAPASSETEERRQIERVMAALAHDIRTPLTGILALSELLAASDLTDRQRGWAKAINSAAEHLAQSTLLVLDAVKADAAGLVLREDRFSPRKLAQDLAASLTARAGSAGLAADVTIHDEVPADAIGDPVRLRAALENLIDNAVKFTARGRVGFDVSAKPATRGRVKLSFAVTDSGIGMSAAEIKALFRPFAQASEEVSRRFGGTGLGLVLVKRLAKAMDGDLAVMSAPGEGSTFTLTIHAGRLAEP